MLTVQLRRKASKGVISAWCGGSGMDASTGLVGPQAEREEARATYSGSRSLGGVGLGLSHFLGL